MRRLMGLFLFGLTFMQYSTSQELNRYDIIIHEIFPDPTPSHGLPQSEFIEIKNNSTKEIDLKNFTISNGSTKGKINYTTILKPDSLLILCSSSSFNVFSVYGNTQVVSGFPSLSNEGDTISLISSNGTVLHAVNYDLTWYHDDFKQVGGWSLEMIRTDYACSGKENWSASRNPIGGTPGQLNSINSSAISHIPVKLSYAYLQDSMSLKMIFNKSLAPNPANMKLLIDEMTLNNVSLEPPLYNIISASVPFPLKDSQKLYDINLEHGKDCRGNEFQISSNVALFTIPQKTELIVNEILFNPESGAYDYVEIMNRSGNTFDLSNIYIANRNSSGKIYAITKMTDEHWPFFPKSLIVCTEDCSWLKQKYKSDSLCWCMELKQLPSFPDDNGYVLLLNESGMLIDELNYDEKWHNKLIFNNDGVALERITPGSMTNDPLNWYSASSQSGYGTPGVLNSQFKSDELSASLIELSNTIVSPDNDGRDDYVLIKYHFPLNGYIANVWITDTRGLIMKMIARNELCGISGQFRWDGLDSKGTKVLPGNYVLISEIFHLNGNVKRMHKSIGVYY